MTEPPGSEPVLDEELLYRRIPVSTGWYDANRTPPLEPEVFRPNRNDKTGISLARAKYKAIQQAASGRPGKQYHVAVLRAGDIRSHGMEIAARPLPDDPGHAEITSLTYDNRKSKQAIEWRTLLAERLCLQIEGPFSTPPSLMHPPRRVRGRSDASRLGRV
jgi:hypothetical protein